MFEASKTLYQQAVGGEFPIELQHAILNEQNLECKCPPYNVAFEKNIWPEHRFNGYDLSFCISIQKNDHPHKIWD